MAILSPDPADQCLVISAHRGEIFVPMKHPDVMVDWLRAHWSQFIPMTRMILVRDTILALHHARYKDRKPWLDFARWGWFSLEEQERDVLNRQFNQAGEHQSLEPILYQQLGEGD